MSIAFLFPGQGSQFVGMAKDFCLESEEARSIMDRADRALGFELSTLCFDGPSEELQLTENTQPAILTHSFIAATELMMKGIYPDYVAGHSLGEISAITVMGSLIFEEGIILVRNRGKYMQQAVPPEVGAMSAIIGLDLEKIKAICENFTYEQVSIANINSPQQVVISGMREHVEEASQLAKEAGALRAIPLSVSAPFHSSLMKPAALKLARDMKQMKFKDIPAPVITNADVSAIHTGDDIISSLIKQVDHPVRWLETIYYFIDIGVTIFVEVGPGRVLSGFMRRIGRGKDISTFSVQDPQSLDQCVSKINEMENS